MLIVVFIMSVGLKFVFLIESLGIDGSWNAHFDGMDLLQSVGIEDLYF